MSVWISDEKLLIFASLISPSKMILFEKKYQTFDTVFHHQMKHCVSCLIYYKKIISSSRAVKILFLSSTCEDIGVGRHEIFLFIRILTFWNRKYKYYYRYFSLITLYPSFKTFL